MSFNVILKNVNYEAQKVSDKVSDKLSDKVSDKLSDKEQYFFTTFLMLVEQNGFVTTKAIAEVIRMPETTARRYLAKLCKLDIIVSDVNCSRKFDILLLSC